MRRKNLFVSYLVLFTGISFSIILPVFLLPDVLTGYRVFIQLFLTFLSMTLFLFIVWTEIKKSLVFLHHTIKKIEDNDPTISVEDKRMIDRMTNIRYFDIKKLITFTNTLLLNQNTILKTAVKDRDFIDKNRKLRDAIIDLNQLIVSGSSLKTIMQKLLNTAIKIIPDCDAGIVFQVTDNTEIIKPVASSGYKMENINDSDFKLKSTYLSRFNRVYNPKPLIIRNRRKIDEQNHTPEELNQFEQAGAYEYNAVLTAPVIIDRDLYGIVSLSSRKNNGFTADDVQLMGYFTSEMGVVIKNSFLIQKAFYLSKYDSLTGVHNRYFFEEMVHLVLQDAYRYNRSIQIVLFDLDNFKDVNDTYGHEAGDKVLKTFAETVSASIRESDIFARFGGDEFTALFHDCDKSNLQNRIQAIIEKLETTPALINGEKYFIKYSYGIAGFPDDAKTYDDLLQLADRNMYKHKAEHKNTNKENQDDSLNILHTS